MGSFKIDIEINRDVHTVFRVLSDVRAMPHWYEAVNRWSHSRQRRLGSVLGSRSAACSRADRSITRSSSQTTWLTSCSPLERVGTNSVSVSVLTQPSGQNTRLHLEGQITGEGLPGPLGSSTLTTQLFQARDGRKPAKAQRPDRDSLDPNIHRACYGKRLAR